MSIHQRYSQLQSRKHEPVCGLTFRTDTTTTLKRSSKNEAIRPGRTGTLVSPTSTNCCASPGPYGWTCPTSLYLPRMTWFTYSRVHWALKPGLSRTSMTLGRPDWWPTYRQCCHYLQNCEWHVHHDQLHNLLHLIYCNHYTADIVIGRGRGHSQTAWDQVWHQVNCDQ